MQDFDMNRFTQLHTLSINFCGEQLAAVALLASAADSLASLRIVTLCGMFEYWERWEDHAQDMSSLGMVLRSLTLERMDVRLILDQNPRRHLEIPLTWAGGEDEKPARWECAAYEQAIWDLWKDARCVVAHMHTIDALLPEKAGVAAGWITDNSIMYPRRTLA